MYIIISMAMILVLQKYKNLHVPFYWGIFWLFFEQKNGFFWKVVFFKYKLN
jgi:hypothetical protein